ncbi:MAG: sigma-70 family RNA polymerase sigma factor [Myxococcota bacterium]
MSPEPDELWRTAMAEPSPFVRAELFERAATVLIASCGGELRHFCARALEGDMVRAEDVAQRACMTFWKVLPRFAGRSTLKTFLFGIAQNVCRRARRDEGRASRLTATYEELIRDEVHPDDLVAVDEARERRERARLLEDALARMDERDAWLLRARFVEELGYGDMLPRYQRRFGAHITTPEGLRTAFFHAKKRLESKLGGTR